MNRNLHRLGFWSVAVVLFALVLASVAAFGQAVSGDVNGNIFDASGAVVTNATVTALNEDTGFKVTVKANDHGEFRFGNLPTGNYTMTATAPSFRAAKVSHFAVKLATTTTQVFNLQPGTATETVEVTAGAPPIDTTTAQISGSFNTTELQDLPTASIGAGVLNLALLEPGSASTGGLGAGSGPSVGGQRPRNNNFTIEGVDNNDKGVTGPVVDVPNDAVSEFTTLQNQFSPEFGHSTGGQYDVSVRTGTNSFHGKAYEYLQNRKLNAIDTSLALAAAPARATLPRFDNNRFGGQIGGPIIKNKLFAFFNYQYNPIGQAATAAGGVFAPTAAGYAALAAIPGLNQTSIGQVQKYAVASTSNGGSLCVSNGLSTGGVLACQETDPTKVLPGTQVAIDLGNLNVIAPNFSNTAEYVLAVDYNLSDKDQIRVRWVHNHTAALDTAGFLPVFFTNNPVTSQLATVQEFHTFTPTVANEFRASYLRTGFNITTPNLTFPGLDAFPNLFLGETGLNLGPDPNGPQGSQQNLYTAVDNVTVTRGRHSFKFGVEGRKYISPQTFVQRSRGDYEWNLFDNFAHDVTPDIIAERSFGSVGYNGNQAALYWYINDNWKVSNNLTLNLGLRYEYTSTPYGWTQQSLNSVANAPGVITFGSPKAPKKDFAPRVGFAYSPGTKGDWAIRGGFGIGYDVLYDNIGVLSRPPQIGSTSDCPGGLGCPTGGFLAGGGIVNTGQTGISVLDQATARANTSGYLPNQVKYPYSIQWNLGVQHTFGSYTAEVRYVGTRGVHLNVQNRINVTDTVTPTNYLPTYFTAPTQAQLNGLGLTLDGPTGLLAQEGNGAFFDQNYLNAGFFGEIVSFQPWGSSTYHGLSGQLTRRFTNGLSFQAGYTYSHNIDNSTADFFSTVVNPRRPQNFRDLQAERGNSALDHRHRFTAEIIYDVPWFKHSNWIARNVIGNWTFAPVWIYETGGYGSVQSARDVNLNTDSAGDRVLFNKAGVKNRGSDVTALKDSAGQTVAYLVNDPTAEYIRLNKGALANSSRNTFLGNGINNLDLTAQKRISITERVNLEFGAQFFNALNHPQYIPGSLNTINSISQTSGAVKSYLTPGSVDGNGNILFGNAKLAFASNARVGQLYLKFSF